MESFAHGSVGAELAFALAGGGMIGVAPAVLKYCHAGQVFQPISEPRLAFARNYRERDRHAFGEVEKAVERRRVGDGIVVAPPEARRSAGRLPDIELRIERGPPGLPGARR